MQKLLATLVIISVLSPLARAQSTSPSSTQQMVAGSTILTGLTLEALIRANSFNFQLGRPLDYLPLSKRIEVQRFGAMSLRNAHRVTIYAELTNAASAHKFAISEISLKHSEVLSRLNGSTPANETARLNARLRTLANSLQELLQLSKAEINHRFGSGLPRTVKINLNRQSKIHNISGLDFFGDRIVKDCDARITSVRVLSRFHNTRVITAMRYTRNGVIAFGTIAALGLLTVEENSAALTAARRNEELARMMVERNSR